LPLHKCQKSSNFANRSKDQFRYLTKNIANSTAPWTIDNQRQKATENISNHNITDLCHDIPESQIQHEVVFQTEFSFHLKSDQTFDAPVPITFKNPFRGISEADRENSCHFPKSKKLTPDKYPDERNMSTI
jgi:hypothetical protein